MSQFGETEPPLGSSADDSAESAGGSAEPVQLQHALLEVLTLQCKAPDVDSYAAAAADAFAN